MILKRKDLKMIGRRITQCRRIYGWTLLDLAGECGYCDYRVREVEHGRSRNMEWYHECVKGMGLRMWVMVFTEERWKVFAEKLKSEREKAFGPLVKRKNKRVIQ